MLRRSEDEEKSLTEEGERDEKTRFLGKHLLGLEDLMYAGSQIAYPTSSHVSDLIHDRNTILGWYS